MRLPPDLPSPPAIFKIGHRYLPEVFEYMYEAYEVILTHDVNTSVSQFSAMIDVAVSWWSDQSFQRITIYRSCISIQTDGRLPHGTVTSYYNIATQPHREKFLAIRRKVARNLGRCDHSDSETEYVLPGGE